MQAILFDGQLHYRADYPKPDLRPGWAVIRMRKAGICKTDMEIMKGYMAFHGVLGHECVGVVEACDDADWVGRRVAPEINAACGECKACRAGLGRHCPNRAVLGILDLDGCMADYCAVPTANLVEIPDNISDDQAVLMEPLAAACEILAQTGLKGSERAVVLGDGRLGILSAWVLSTVLSNVTLVGKHPRKLETAAWGGLKTTTVPGDVERDADLVVEATGASSGLGLAMNLCRPRGTIVLKSTIALAGELNLAPLVINEQTLLGSRCGLFHDALAMIHNNTDIPLDRLITARYPLADAVTAFAHASESGTIKVLFED